MLKTLLKPSFWPIVALAIAAAMLATAHAFEHFLLLAPCPLCLRQREVYWAALILGAIGYGVIRLKPSPRLLITVNVLLALVFITSAVIAGYHAGVEWKFWPGPTACSGGLGDSLAGSAAGMDLDRAFATVSCSEAAWRLFGISMAGYNTLASLLFGALSILAAKRAFEDAELDSTID
ncbi:disulfide bond formation protein B [Ponticaulis profundi]|uniref:Disulfide bond formation protein B n=1 Tax=Ponticaulis profundi TaxID=2665222 RepID=A0ABW1SB89_9PROT